MNKNMF